MISSHEWHRVTFIDTFRRNVIIFIEKGRERELKSPQRHFFKMIKFLEKRRIFSFVAMLLTAAEIFYFSSLSFGSSGKGGISFSAVYHFVIFFLFNFFLLMAIKGKKELKAKHLAITLLISVIYAVSDEIHQTFIPGRNAGITDILTDTAGIFASSHILLLFHKESVH